jgi:Glycosyl transferase family 2
MNPVASILIDNFNYAEFLPRSIESALGQTAGPLEVVVVDDASTDSSLEVIRSYGDRIVPVLRPINGGQGAAINAGFSASHGPVLLLLDADDYLYPHAVETVLAHLRPGVSKVQYRLDLVDRDERRIDLYPPTEVRLDSGDVVPALLERGRYETPVTSGNAFPRSVLERILPIPELDFRISADGYLISAAPFYGPVVSIDRPLGGYRQHGKNAWSGDSASRSLDALAEWLRRTLSHDDLKYRIIAEEARRTGKKAHTAPGLRDPGHLTTRLASACLAPEAHPYASDTRLGLGLRGLFHSWSASLPWGRRAVLASWFLAAGILPRALARPATAWMLAPGSRPVGVARALKLARRLLRGGKRPSPRATGGDSSTSTQSS